MRNIHKKSGKERVPVFLERFFFLKEGLSLFWNVVLVSIILIHISYKSCRREASEFDTWLVERPFLVQLDELYPTVYSNCA